MEFDNLDSSAAILSAIEDMDTYMHQYYPSDYTEAEWAFHRLIQAIKPYMGYYQKHVMYDDIYPLEGDKSYE